MHRGLLCLLVACFSGSAVAGIGDIDALVAQAAALKQPIESLVNGQRAKAVPVPGVRGRCARVGVIYQSVQSRGPERISNFEVCGQDVVELVDTSPALPNDQNVKQFTADLMRAAALYGQRAVNWDAYSFVAKRLTPQDAGGCAFVDLTVVSEDLLVAHTQGKACP